MKTAQTKITAQTLLVNALDMDRLSTDLNNSVHKNHPDDDQTYKVRARLAIVLEPKMAMFDHECVGQTKEPFEICVHGEGERNGTRYFEAIPRYTWEFPIEDLKTYIKDQQTLKDFMGDNYRPEHHRVGRNIESWLDYFNS